MKLFSINEDSNNKIYNICGIKIKLSKTFFELKHFKFNVLKCLFGKKLGINFYLNKYLYVQKFAKNEFDLLPKSEINQSSDYIWTMWLQDEIPELIQVGLESIKKIYPNAILITEKNIFDYVNIPEYIYKKYKEGIIEPPHFSDYIRMYLLDKYGGTWIDASCLMLRKVPNFITKQSFFIFQNPTNKNISNFFIHSAKNNYFTKVMRIFFEEYWNKENVAINYFFFHIFFQILRKNSFICKEIFNEIIPYPNSIVRYFTDNIYLNYDADAWDFLSKTCFMYKLQRKDNRAIDNLQSWYYFFVDNRKKIITDNVNATN